MSEPLLGPRRVPTSICTCAGNEKPVLVSASVPDRTLASLHEPRVMPGFWDVRRPHHQVNQNILRPPGGLSPVSPR